MSGVGEGEGDRAIGNTVLKLNLTICDHSLQDNLTSLKEGSTTENVNNTNVIKLMSLQVKT